MFNIIINSTKSNLDWGNITAVLIAGGVGALATIFSAYISTKMQKEMWIKDAYIKYESEIITECKKIYDEVFQYICQFENTFISKLAFIVSENNLKKEFDKDNCYEYYIKPFSRLYNIYAKNKQIFVKYGLDKAFQGLNLYIYLLSSTKTIKEITYSPSDILIKDLNQNCDIVSYRADFWYKFPILINNLLNHDDIILLNNNDGYKSQITDSIIKNYEDVLFYYKNQIREIDSILNKIMLVSEINKKILPTYINECSLSYYKEFKKGNINAK